MPLFPEIDVHQHSPDKVLLPTPEDKVKELSRSQPVALVPIDITGSAFDRMCEYRESVRSTSRRNLEDGVQSLKRKKRRPTVSGVPGLVLNEVGTNIKGLGTPADVRLRAPSRGRSDRPKSAALDIFAPKSGVKKCERNSEWKKNKDKKDKRDHLYDPEGSNLARSCSLRRSLKSLFKDKRSKSTDLWAKGIPECPGPPVVNLNIPLKRSRSLPRSLKSVMQQGTGTSNFAASRSASTEGRLDAQSDENISTVKRTSSFQYEGKSTIKPNIPRSLSHNVNVSCSTFVDNLDRTKSMEIFPHTSLGNDTSHHHTPRSIPQTPTSTDNITSTPSENSCSSIHIHIPEKPWTKPFADVKLRVNRKLKHPVKDERQSSSGGL